MNEVTNTSVTLSWTENGTATAWQICLNGDEADPMDVNTNPCTLTDLTPEMTYTAKVCASQDGAYSGWSNEIEFLTVTYCPAPSDLSIDSLTANAARLNWIGTSSSFQVKYRTKAFDSGIFEGFTNINSTPLGWSEKAGWLSDVLDGTSSLMDGSFWDYGYGMHDVFDEHASLDINSNTNKWLISPIVALREGSSLHFDVAVTSFFPGQTIWFDGNDRLVVVVYDENADIWNILQEWNNTGSPFAFTSISATGVNYTIDLSAYSGKNVRIAFYVERSNNQLDVRLNIDNINISSPVPNSEWQTAMEPDTSHILTGLQPETLYEVEVKGVCTESLSLESDTLSFWTHGFAPSNLAANDITYNAATLSWTENGLAYVWQICLNGDEINLIEANTNPYPLTNLAYNSDCAVKVRSLHRGIPSDWSDELIFTTTYILPPTNVTVSDIAYFSVNMTWTENGTATAWQICLNDVDTIAADANPFSLTGLTPDTEYALKVRSQQGGYFSSWSDATNFTTPFYCYPPTQLAITEATLNSATLGWTDHGTATAWQICVNGNETNLVTVNSNHYVLTNLDAQTQYTVKVRAICGETYSEWSDELSFIPVFYCNPPTLTVSNITTTTADLSWEAIAGADSYSVNLNAPLSEHTYPIITSYTATEGTTGVNDEQDYDKLVDNDRSTKWCASLGNGIYIEFHSENDFIPTAYILTTGNDNQSFHGRNPKNWVIKAKLNANDSWTTIATVTNDNVLQDNNTTDYTFTLNNTNAYRYFRFEVSAVQSGSTFQLSELRFRGQVTTFHVTSTNLHLTDLMPETDYAVKIRCNKGGSASAWSDETIFTTPGLPPSNLTVTPKTFSSVALGWTENGTATQWQICLDDNENNPIDAPTNPFTITGLAEQTQYAAKVRACRGGVYTSWSNAKSFTTLPYCPAPTGLSALNITCNSMMLSWNQDGSVNDWQICLNNDETNAITVTTNPYILTGLASNTPYSVKVRGRNGGENYSDWSNPFYFSTTTFYPAPANLAYNDLTFNSVILNWSQSDNATEWRICLNDDMTNQITVTTNPYTLTSLNPESPYAVKVSAYHDGNFSGWSNEVNFTTPVITPTLTVSDLTQTNAKLNWTATSGANYTVMYNLSDGNLMPILSQDFENGLNSWSFSHNITETSTTIVDNEHHTGSHCFKFIANYAGTEQFLFTPRFENCHLYEFFYKTNNTDETFRINYYINNALQFSSEEITVNTHGLWQKYSCEIPSNIQSVGICYHPGAPGVLFVDDIVVSAEHIIINTTTNSAQISNLTPETEYTAKVRTKHGNLYSAWSDAVNFTTEMPPTNLTVSNVAETVANFNWTENGTATQWQLCLNNDQANPIPAPTKPFTLTGLTQETHYTAKVRSCHEGVYSAWSGTVDFTTLAYCHAPTDLAVDDITRHSATLSWNANSDSYKVFYRTTGEWILAAENLSETTFTLTELISETQYEACVKGVCNGIESNASASISFTTLLDNSPTLTVCDITCTSAGCFWTEIPGADSYTFSFNDTLEIPVTVGYTATSGTQGNDGENYPNLVDNNKRSKWFVNNNNNGVFGGAYIEFHSRHDFVPTGYVLTTAHDTDSEPNHKGRNPKSWVIKAKLHLNDPWTTIASVTNNYVMQNEPLRDYEFTLNNSTPYRYFRFEVLDVQNTNNHRFQLGEMKFLGYSKNNIYLTDLTPATAYSVKVRAKSGDVYSEWSDVVTFNTFYPTPTNPTVTNIDYFSATMGWTDNAGANHWQICLNGDEDHPITADTNPYTLTGLTQQTDYTAKVRVWQNGNYSPWSDEVGFSTPIYCHAPTDFAVNNITYNSATLNWTGTSDSYKVLYRTTGEWTIEECTETTFNLTGLEANTYYEACVKGVCNGIESIASNTVSFHTMLNVAPPTIIVNNITQTTADLDWTALPDADYYTVSLNNSIIDETQVITGYTATSGTEGYNTNEDYPNLVDNNRSTKWCTAIGNGIFIEFHSDSIFTPTGYILTTGGDNATAHGRNPKNWVIKAKLNAEDSWTTIDSITNDQVLQDVNTTDFEFSLNNNRAYRYFRFEALAVHSGSTFQLGELRFKGIALTNHLHLTDLIPETEYVVKVRVWQNGSYSHWSDEVHFTTWTPPTNLTVTEITQTTASLSWIENGNATQWQLCLNGDEDHLIAVDSNPFTLTDLTQQTTYTAKVRYCQGGTAFGVWSDETEFTTLAFCDAPIDLAIEGITTHSAILNWNGTSDTYVVMYRTTGNWILATENLTDTTFTFIGLTSGTAYEVGVKGVCGSYESIMSNTVSFTTLYDIIPPTLSVNNLTQTTADLCWTETPGADSYTVSMNGSTIESSNLIFAGYTATEGTAGANSNQGFAKLVDNNRNSKWCTGIGNGIYIEFHHRFSFIPTGYILTTGNDNSSYGGRNPKNWVIKAKLNADDDWTTIATVTNDNVLQDVNTTDFEFALDNNTAYRYFRFEVSAVHSGSTFQLSELRFRGRAANTLPLTNLTPDTDYSVIIRGNFGETSSEWSDPLNFNTYAPPTNLTVSDIDLYSATLSWTENGTANQWQICLNDNEDNLITVNTNPYTLTGLTPQTHYTAKVRDYQGGAIAIWSNEVGFRTNLDVVPPTPTISDITLTSAVINWTEMPGASNYLISLNDSIILAPIITGYTATKGTGGYNNENYPNLVDNKRNTKWCAGIGNGVYIEFHSDSIFIPMGYILTTGGDSGNHPGRNPKNWVIRAKLNVDDDWTTIDSITNDNVLQDVNTTDFEFSLNNNTAYRYFRFEASAIHGGTSFQLGELRFRGRYAANSMQLTDLIPETSYSAKVRCNVDGAFTHWSNAVNFITFDGVIFIADGYWNESSNWNTGQIPGVNDDVLIAAQAIIPADYTAQVNTVSVNGGSLTINDGGQLIHNNAGVTATVEKAIIGHGGDNGSGWNFIASPITTAITPDDENGLASGEYDLYYYDEVASYWRNYKESDNSINPHFDLNNSQGYLYANLVDKTLLFTGTIQAGDNGSHTIDNLSYACVNEDLKGFNLVGNPFACDATIDRSFYVINGRNVVANTGSTVIPPCTGVMVKAADEGQTVTFTKVTAQQGSKPSQLQLTLSQQGLTRAGVSTTVDNAIVSFNRGDELDKFYFGNDAKLYIPQGNKDYAIAFAEAKMGEMPLNFKANKDGEYTLTVSSIPNSSLLTSNFQYLHLIDNLTGDNVDLLVEPSYTFTGRTTDYASRFRLVFVANDADLGVEGNDDFAFISNGELIILGEGILQVFDALGRQCFAKEIFTPHSSLLTPHFPVGVYVLQLINANEVRTQKIIIK